MGWEVVEVWGAHNKQEQLGSSRVCVEGSIHKGQVLIQQQSMLKHRSTGFCCADTIES